MKTSIRQFIVDTLLICAGCTLIAASINGFLRPHGFLSGGMSGTSLIVFYSWPSIPIPFGVLYLLLNIPVFALGYFVVGRKFILYSVWAALIHSMMFTIVTPVFDVHDKLLSALVGGVLGGTGVALVLRTNGTSSGTEIISIVINKFYSVNLSVTTMLMNTVLMLIASLFLPFESILYSLVYIVMAAQSMNAVSKGLAKRKAVMIISQKWEEILKELRRDRKIGATLLSAKGGYMGTDNPLLYSIVKSHQVSVVRTVTTRIDPAAFIVIMETTDIINDTVGNQPPWKKQLYSNKR